MQVLNRQKSEDKITQYAREGCPFLFIIDFSGSRALVMTPDEALENNIFFDVNGTTNHSSTPQKIRPFTFSEAPVSLPVYQIAYEKVMTALNHGDTYLLNLTFPTKLVTDLTPEELFIHSAAGYKLMAGNDFVVFSPETFIRIRDGRIFSYPMKGTIPASVPHAAETILADRKELYEHNTIVDLIRNDIGMVATNVQVTRFRYLERITSRKGDLLQVSSEITGELPPDYLSRLGEILFTLLPAGSVTGAPKKRTVEIILGAESYDRGFYTGVFGFFDGKSLDSAVMIRFIEFTPEGPVYKSGGGITALSDLKSEYEEMIRKVYVPFV
jgi:para-aminobenzoate synthetase component 1